MTRTLHLTSPLMHGSDVVELQVLLRKHGYLDDVADGIYGVHTAQAVYRAKYWLGYLNPDKSAAALLFSYLAEDRKPNPAMRALAARRRAKQKAAEKRRGNLTKGQAVLKKALPELGETEHPPNSNRSKYSLWYGIVGAWCAMFCTWCAEGVFKAWKRGERYAYCPYVRADAIQGRNGLMVTTSPRTGDFPLYDWQRDGTADHIGVYASEDDLRRFAPKAFESARREFGPLGEGEFWAVEGNTGVGNDSNGGIVMIRKRPRSLVQTFVRAS